MGLPSEARTEVIVTAVLFGFTTIVLVLRFASHRFVRRGFDASDLFAVVAYFLIIACAVDIILWATVGYNGRHMDTLNSGQLETFKKYFYANQIIYFCLAPCIKFSILFFYYSIFASDHKFEIASIIVGTCIGAWGIAIITGGIFQCTPIKAFWDPTAGACFNERAFTWGVQLPNILFDFTLLVMTWPIIWKMDKPRKNRLQLLGVFSLGAVGVCCSIGRAIALSEIEESDLTYTIYSATVWTLAEPCVALTCGSLPIIRRAYRGWRSQHRKRQGPTDTKSSSDPDTSTTRSIPTATFSNPRRSDCVYVRRDFTLASTEHSDDEYNRRQEARIFPR